MSEPTNDEQQRYRKCQRIGNQGMAIGYSNEVFVLALAEKYSNWVRNEEKEFEDRNRPYGA